MVKGKASSYMGGGYKRAFDLQRFAQVDNPYEFDIDNNKLVDIDTQRTLADLSYYARNNIANYQTVTEIPQENIEYLGSGLIATNIDSIFSSCRALTSIPWNEFDIDTSQVTDMRYMFYYCSALTSLDLSNMDTSQCTDMSSMFQYCNALTGLNVSNFDTSQVTDMYSMFSECYLLTNLDLSNFNTSQATSMYGMFSVCKSLTSLDLSNFDTSKVTNMRYMFQGCNALTSLDLSNFNTSKVTDMGDMFENCYALISLDLSNFNTSKVTIMNSMFYQCRLLQEIICPNGFDLSSCTSVRYMFNNCNPSYNGEPLHFKNVPRDLDFSRIGGTEGTHYVIDSYKD